MNDKKSTGVLLLEDGTTFYGQNIGASRSLIGEIVFNTGMTGYQEIFTDPSYYGQIITMTYPLIGNYGLNLDDFESLHPALFGLIVKEDCDEPSHYKSFLNLKNYLQEYNIPGLSGVDTRKLTKHIRNCGHMKALITDEASLDESKALLENALPTNQVSMVSTKNIYRCPNKGPRLVLVDFGHKHAILKRLSELDFDVIVVPHNITVNEIKRLGPKGIVLSNGPGDPKDVDGAVDLIKELQGHYPLFGICLGHQLFALANGADTTKMKFGHRGCNHPVKNLITGKSYITSQNHGFTISSKSLEGTDLEATHINLNDGSVEGLRHKNAPAFSVQFHPEACPGPEDTEFLFQEFFNLIRQGNQNASQ